jgi:AbrB family looped-hinge helix DNA binding protein
MLSTVTTKGQVTIPADIRTRFHIQPNDKVDFYVDGEHIIITPVRTLKQLRGVVVSEREGNIASERETAKNMVAERIAGETV